MTVVIRELWDHGGAPVKRRQEIEAAQAEYFDAIAKVGISREAYLIAARHALKEARVHFDAMAIRSRNSTAPDDTDPKETGLARFSTILGSFGRLLQDYGRAGWALCWGSIRTLAKTFGTNARAAWERLRMLRDAGLVRAWDRWKDELHDYEEGRTSVYLLMVPVEIFAWWATTSKAQAVLASLAGSDTTAPSPAPSLPPSAPPAPRSRPRSQPPPAALPAFFPALFHEVRGADERYLGEDERGGGTMKAANALECEDVLAEEAAAARAYCEKQGLPPPDVAALARELGRMVVGAWLKETGKDGLLTEKRHVIGLILFDVRRLAAAARGRWQKRRARPVEPAGAPPAPVRDKPRFATPPPPSVLAAAAPSAPAETRPPLPEHRTTAGPAPDVAPATPDKPPPPD